MSEDIDACRAPPRQQTAAHVRMAQTQHSEYYAIKAQPPANTLMGWVFGSVRLNIPSRCVAGPETMTLRFLFLREQENDSKLQIDYLHSRISHCQFYPGVCTCLSERSGEDTTEGSVRSGCG